MNGNRPSHPPRQVTLTFTRNTIGPRLPRTAWCDTQALLAQLLADIIREEIPQRGGEYERQDP